MTMQKDCINRLVRAPELMQLCGTDDRIQHIPHFSLILNINRFLHLFFNFSRVEFRKRIHVEMGDCSWVHFKQTDRLLCKGNDCQKNKLQKYAQYVCSYHVSFSTVELFGKAHSLVVQTEGLTSFCKTVFQMLH